MFSHDFAYVGLDAILGQMMYSKVDSIGNTTFLMSKVNDYILFVTETLGHSFISRLILVSNM